MIVFWFTDVRASNCYQETVRKDIILLFLNPSNVKVLENLKTIVSLLQDRWMYFSSPAHCQGVEAE